MKNRRSFLKGVTGAGVLTAASYRRVIGANERVRVGFIGIGLIGKRHLLDFMAQPDVEVAAICETYEPRLREGIETAGNRPEGFRDFRRMYERKDIDAVCVSTPDHWHALQTILACAAGKDVYVEKPLTHVVAEGRWMTEAMKHYKRVVQVGTQQRSGEQYHKCVELIRSGHIGEVRSARITAYRNIMPGFTQPVGTEALSESDWQMWLGPAPYVPFDRNRCIYHFRWFRDYSGGQTTNLLSHDLDIVQWAMNAAPRAVAAFGGRYSLKGFGETPDVVEAVFDYPGFVLHWSCREITMAEGRGLEFQGTKGRLRVSRAGIEVIPDRLIPADDQIPRFTEPPRAQAEVQYRTEAFKREGYEQVRDQFRPHVRNFIDSVRSRRQPLSDLESAHRTATSCHLVNIAMKLGRSLRWDAQKEEVIGDAEANRMLTKKYRSPWDRELRAALPGKISG
ncbi:MAG TPA: Gfo/Idh/MocA family oxidoreductase [Blastocatellia bacterium]|nr:Gfo/Idh/MocA family oxidoreductase [Blastocatellia bacterium]